MILHPGRDAALKGPSFDLADTGNICIEAAQHLAFYNLRNHQLTPKDWRISECYAAKKSEAPGAKGRRLVNVLRVLGKGLFATC
eukprot:7962064-Pyramimonas_sp.AAC.1